MNEIHVTDNVKVVIYRMLEKSPSIRRFNRKRSKVTFAPPCILRLLWHRVVTSWLLWTALQKLWFCKHLVISFCLLKVFCAPWSRCYCRETLRHGTADLHGIQTSLEQIYNRDNSESFLDVEPETGEEEEYAYPGDSLLSPRWVMSGGCRYASGVPGTLLQESFTRQQRFLVCPNTFQ